MQNRRNYYRILCVQPDAPGEVIRTSYRTLMQRLKMHPDLGGDHWNAALINEAFATLSHPEKRAAYDKTMAAVRERQRSRGQTAPSPSPSREPPPPAPVRHSAQGIHDKHACSFCGAPHAPRDANQPSAACGRCGSPLFPVAKYEGGKTSRRALERMPRNMPVTFSLAGPPAGIFEGTTHDISMNGMSFTSTRELSRGERVRIECAFCDAVGVVTHVHKGPSAWHWEWHVGVEFLTLRVKQMRGAFMSIHA